MRSASRRRRTTGTRPLLRKARCYTRCLRRPKGSPSRHSGLPCPRHPSQRRWLPSRRSRPGPNLRVCPRPVKKRGIVGHLHFPRDGVPLRPIEDHIQTAVPIDPGQAHAYRGDRTMRKPRIAKGASDRIRNGLQSGVRTHCLDIRRLGQAAAEDFARFTPGEEGLRCVPPTSMPSTSSGWMMLNAGGFTSSHQPGSRQRGWGNHIRMVYHSESGD